MDNYVQIKNYLKKHNEKMDKTFKNIIIDLLTHTNFNYDIFVKILNGAYIIIKDNGYFFKKWTLNHKLILYKSGKKLRPIISNLDGVKIIFNESSHHSCNEQYRMGEGIIFDIFNNNHSNVYDLLVGTSCKYLNKECDKVNCNTWFQLEKHRLGKSSINHFIDYINHKIFDVNIGPFGETSHTVNKPIILEIIR